MINVRTVVWTLLSASLGLCPGVASAYGEVFLIETSGLESCGDFNHHTFNATNNVDLYARVDSSTQLSVSTTPSFLPENTITLPGVSYIKTNTGALFVASQTLGDGAFITVRGRARFDAYGTILSLTGAYIQNGIFYDNCFSTGNFRSKKLT